MPRLDDETWNLLQRDVTRAVAARVPEWTDHQTGDPGVTILELLAYVVEELAARGVPEAGRAWAARMVEALSEAEGESSPAVYVNGEPWSFVPSLAGLAGDAAVFTIDEDGAVVFGDGEHGRRPPAGSRIGVRFRHGVGAEGHSAVTVRSRWPFNGRLYYLVLSAGGAVRFDAGTIGSEEWSGVKRLRYFAGRLLTADDYRDEQQYFLRKHRRHQKTLHGSGVVSGLRVEGSTAGGPVMVRPGVAIDAQGREIFVADDVCLGVPAGTASPAYVVVEYAERATDAVPSPSGPGLEATRIEEGCRVLLRASGDSGGVPIARLVGTGGGWQVDGSFVPPRAD